MAAGKFRPVADHSGFRHLLGDIERADETLPHHAVAAGRVRPTVTHGTLTHLQAVDRLALDQGRERAGGLDSPCVPVDRATAAHDGSAGAVVNDVRHHQAQNSMGAYRVERPVAAQCRSDLLPIAAGSLPLT